MIVVYIEGRDIRPCLRLLDALTCCGFLDSRVTWEESLDAVKVSISSDDVKVKRMFQDARFRVLD